jgi:mRNA-binding protein PUF3
MCVPSQVRPHHTLTPLLQSRNRDFSGGVSLNNTETERSTFNSMPWANSIWNNKPIGSTFAAGAATSRDGSNTFAGATADSDGRTGSGSLVSSSETEWRPTRQSQAWGDNSSTNIAHARSSAASPARKRSIAQAQSAQQYADNSSSFFPVSRTLSVGHAPGSNPLKAHLDPTSTNFTSSRHIDSLNTGFAGFGFGQAENSPQRADPASWQDAGSVHSPNDDRRSVAASDHFDTSSGAPSRSGSLPPSRHGAETGQYNPYADSFARYAQAGPRQGSSLSHAVPRTFQERSGSIQSESWQTLAQLKLEQEQDSRMLAQRSSISINAFTPSFTPAAQEASISRDNYQDAQPAAHIDSPAYRNSGTYTPDSYANGQVNDTNVQFRSVQYESRGTPNGTGVRQSPFYSHTNTPPVHDYLNPTYRGDQGLSHPSGIALVQNKLAGYQVQQERRNIAPPQFYQQQYQHVVPVSQLRNPHAYQYAMTSGMPMTALPPHMTMVQMTPMISGVEPPRGPRVQQANESIGAMSLVLDAFKKESKQNKRWELTDIYENVVEFAGDQHGSRFIQQKLETANSEVKDRIFRELEKNALQLMQDVFGNYVIQKFFEHGDQTQKRIMASKMKGHVLALSNQMYACRVVQKVCRLLCLSRFVD